LAQQSNAGLVVLPDILTSAQAQLNLIVARTAQHRIPAVYPIALFARAGGLVSCEINTPDMQRRAAADRVLKGAKPQDLPVQLPTSFELVINLKAAKTLGLTVPATLLATADEVIE
jgi:putative tryptophan/tyrosine transport system substrate-binding protein